jgi:hypothetical protein
MEEVPETPAAAPDRWRWARRAAPYVVAGVAVAAILYQYPLGKIVAEMERGDTIAMIPVALAAIGVVWITATTSDYCVLPPTVEPMTFRFLLRAKAGVSVLNALGQAANYGGYGLWIQRRFRCPAKVAAGAVLFIALSDLCAVTILASLGVWIGGVDLPGTAAARLDVIVPAVAAVAVVLVFARPPGAPLGLAPWHRIPRATRLAGLVARLGNILVLIVATWAAARAFGMPLPFGAVASHLPILLVIAALPINVGGFGPIQAAWVAFFSPWASGAQILAFHFLWHLLVFAAMMLRGAPFLRAVVADVTGAAPRRAA